MFLLEHRVYWYTYKDRYIQFMTWIRTVSHFNLPLRDWNLISLDFRWKTQGTESFTHLTASGFYNFGALKAQWWWNISQPRPLHRVENKFQSYSTNRGGHVASYFMWRINESSLLCRIDFSHANCGWKTTLLCQTYRCSLRIGPMKRNVSSLTLNYCNSHIAQQISRT